jgi:hypothetical protein
MCADCVAAAGCRVLGVEIDVAAVPVQTHPFTGNTAFMLGNEVSRSSRTLPTWPCLSVQQPKTARQGLAQQPGLGMCVVSAGGQPVLHLVGRKSRCCAQLAA